MERVLGALLGVDPSLLDDGVFALGVPVWVLALGVAAGVALVALALGYRDLPRGRHVALVSMRSALVAILVLALARPALVVSEPAGASGTVAVLIDETLSMRVRDAGEEARGIAARAAIGPGSRASEALARGFGIRHLALAGGHVGPLPGTPVLDTAYTDLGAGLDSLRGAFGAAPPAAIVLASDGADGGPAARLDAALLALRAARIPVYTLGVGAPAPERDVEVRFRSLARRALAGDVVEAKVELTHAGLGGRDVVVRVEDEGAIAAEVRVRLPREGGAVARTVRFRLAEPGPRRVRISVAALADEPLVANNEDVRVVEVSDEAARVLHVEGEPRFEVKFLRRALAGDPRLEVTSLVRTAENKFYRLGVRSADELSDGFPVTAEALFAYDALVLGSVEAAMLTPAQQALVADFVARRGGGLVALGGRRALAEGGHARGPLAGVLPVVLGAPAEGFSASAAMRPTAEGIAHPALEALAAADWENLPRLTIVNPVRAVKPGATVLIEADTDAAGPLVGLAVQRYGRGLAAALPVRDTWRWQLHPTVELEDVTHEQFWRQLLRWAVASAMPRLSVEAEPATPGPGQPTTIRVTAFDAAWQPASAGIPALEVEDPAGERRTLAVEAVPGEPGVFRATLVPGFAGRHDLVARLDAGDDALTSTLRTEVVTGGHEFHGAGLDAALLARIARETGGAYLPIARAGELATLIRAPSTGPRETRRVPLGRAPMLLGLLIALLCAEWIARRFWRLA